jgi:hypothetical protein
MQPTSHPPYTHPSPKNMPTRLCTAPLTGVEARVEPPQNQQLQGAAQVVEVRHAQQSGGRGPARAIFSEARGVLAVALFGGLGLMSINVYVEEWVGWTGCASGSASGFWF